MQSLYEILKTSKLGAGSAPDMYTALWGKAIAGGGGSAIEYTGAVPVTIRANGEPLLACRISGNMQQTGTPTHQNPITPQETGERTAQLFDKNGEILVGNGSVINILATGIKTIIETAGSNRYSLIKLDNELLGKTITISSTITQSANNKGQIRLFYVNGRYATSSIAAITTAGQTGYITRTYTMPSSIPSGSDGIAIVLSADREGNGEVGDYVEYADLMIVEGSTAPSSYIPYGIKIPISSGNTTTPVYLGEVESTRQIKQLVLTGQESITTSGAISNCYYISVSDYLYVRATEIAICTHYEVQANVNGVAEMIDKRVSFYANQSNILHIMCIRDTSFATKEDLASYLAAQYAAGTPVCVWYVLATPTTGIVNEPLRKIGDYADTISNVAEIPTTAGEQTFDVQTTLKPSEVYIKYRGG